MKNTANNKRKEGTDHQKHKLNFNLEKLEEYIEVEVHKVKFIIKNF